MISIKLPFNLCEKDSVMKIKFETFRSLKLQKRFNSVHLLAGHRTCQSKCGVEIYRKYGYMFTNFTPYSFRTFTVIFGNKSATNYTCTSSSYPADSHIRINCSSWKHGKNVYQDID